MVTVMQQGLLCLISAHRLESDSTVPSAEVTMTGRAETQSPPLPLFKAVLSIWSG